jgi:hypothetical protein
MAKINVRSPYYIHDTVANYTRAQLELYIYPDTKTTDRPTDATYTLTTNAIDDKVTFEISELIKDYFANEFDGDYASDFYWIDYEISRSVSGGAYSGQGIVNRSAFYGYGFYEDGVQNTTPSGNIDINDSGLLQTNTKIVKLDDAPAVIPVDTSKTTQVTYEKNGEQVYTKAISSSNEADEQIEYVTSGVNGSDVFEDRVIQDGGTFEGSVCLKAFEGEFELFDFDTIYIDTDDGVIKVTVQNIEECKYTPYKVTFINKFGALQDVWFFKRSNETLTTKQEKFKRNIAVDGSYTVSKHQDMVLTKNGMEKLTLNTGYYPEEYNEVFKQMQLSEDCWIEINSQTLPINISGGSFNYKTHLNDKLINYTIQVDFAFDTINNIR